MGDRTVRQWIRDTHVPMVMTSVTEEAERSCKKNGLTFTEMLSAFATVQCTVPIRTVAHHYSLKQFRLRFVPSAEVAPLPVELADRHLARVVNARVPAAEQLLEHAPIDDGTSTDDARARCSALRGTTTGSTPWYASFVRGLWASTQCQEHEMLDCPAACLLVVSSANDEPINCFDELGSPHYLPQVFQRGQFEPVLNKIYVLLHDVTDPASAGVDPTAMLKRMKSRYPPAACKLLCINSLPADQPNMEQQDIWSNLFRDPFFSQPEHAEGGARHGGRWQERAASAEADAGGAGAAATAPHAAPAAAGASGAASASAHPGGDVLGCFLSSTDLDNIRTFCTELTLKGVLPFLEARMFSLNSQVAAAKKGVKNVLKSWWRTPKREEESSRERGALRYRYNSIEAQVRLLADSAFMLQDYEVALQHYRIAREDFRADKAWSHYAGATEMVAMSLFMMKGNRRDMDIAFQQAFEAHSRVAGEDAKALRAGLAPGAAGGGPAASAGAGGAGGAGGASPSARLATRVMVLAAEVYSTTSATGVQGGKARRMEAAEALLRAAPSERGLVAALLLEQAAHSYLQAAPQPRYRKYAFYLVLAGHQYHDARCSVHAVRCYAAAMAVYTGRSWENIEDHVHFTLSRQLYELRRPAAAIHFFLRLIGTGRQSAENQDIFVKEFLFVVRAHREQALQAQAQAQARVQDGTAGDGASAMVASNTTSSMEAAGALGEIEGLALPHFDDGSVQLFTRQNAADVDFAFGGGANSNGLSKGNGKASDRGSMRGNAAAGSSAAATAGVSSSASQPSSSMQRSGRSRAWQQLETGLERAEAAQLAFDRIERRFHSAVERLRGVRAGTIEGRLESAVKAVAAADEDRRPLSDIAAEMELQATRGGRRRGIMAEAPRWQRLGGTPNSATASAQPGRGNAVAKKQLVAVGEPVYVRVAVSNPLAIAVELKNLQLVVELHAGEAEGSAGASAGPDADISDMAVSDSPIAAMHYASEASAPGTPAPALRVDQHTVTLEPKQQQEVTLCFCPLKVGELRVVGVRWCLYGEVWGRHRFERQGPLLHATRAQRASRARAEDLTLQATVLPPAPWVAMAVSSDPTAAAAAAAGSTDDPGSTAAAARRHSATLDLYPTIRMLEGELQQVFVALTNRGRAPLVSPAAPPEVVAGGTLQEKDAFNALLLQSNVPLCAVTGGAAGVDDSLGGSAARVATGGAWGDDGMDDAALGDDAGAGGDDRCADKGDGRNNANQPRAIPYGAAGMTLALFGIHLEPGESVTLPLWLRAPALSDAGAALTAAADADVVAKDDGGGGSGNEDGDGATREVPLRLLLCYREPPKPKPEGAKRAPLPCERLIRAAARLRVSPSLAITAIARPSYNRPGQYVLVVEAQCTAERSAVEQIHLYQVSAISSSWKLQPIAPDGGATRDGSAGWRDIRSNDDDGDNTDGPRSLQPRGLLPLERAVAHFMLVSTKDVDPSCAPGNERQESHHGKAGAQVEGKSKSATAARVKAEMKLSRDPSRWCFTDLPWSLCGRVAAATAVARAGASGGAFLFAAAASRAQASGLGGSGMLLLSNAARRAAAAAVSGDAVAGDTALLTCRNTPHLDFVALDNAGATLLDTVNAKREAAKQRAVVAASQGPQSIASVRRAAGKKRDIDDGEPENARVFAPPASVPALMADGAELHLLVMWAARHRGSATSGDTDGDADGSAVAGAGDSGAVAGRDAELPLAGHVIGQHVVRKVSVRPEPAPRQCPLTLTVQYSPQVNHDFGAAPFCAVDVLVRVRNGAAPTSAASKFVFKLLPADEARVAARGAAASGSVQQVCALRPRFFWAGCTRRKINALVPGQSVAIRLRACFTRPGVYNLNRFQFHVHHRNSSKPTIFVFPSPYLVSVFSTVSNAKAPIGHPAPLQDQKVGREQQLVPQAAAAAAAGEPVHTPQEGTPSFSLQEQQQVQVPRKQGATENGGKEVAPQQQEQEQQQQPPQQQQQQQQQQEQQHQQHSSLDLDDGLFDLDSA